MTDLKALVVSAHVFADEYRVPARPGRRPLVTDAELVALAVAQAAIGISSDRQFLGLIGRVLPRWFPHLPDQSQYNRRLPNMKCSSSMVAGTFFDEAFRAIGLGSSLSPQVHRLRNQIVGSK